jgi:sugar phosphate isomerase/epimerase
MKSGLLTGVRGKHPRAGAFDIAVDLGLDTVELGTGESTLDWHVGLDSIVDDPKAVDAMRNDLESRGLEISAARPTTGSGEH